MTITIEHSGDGTTVEGTERGDQEVRGALKVAGFKWSSSLGAWYLPRTWTESTRRWRALQLHRALEQLERDCALEMGPLAKSTTAEEQAAAHVERAEQLAERHESRAERLGGEADAHYQRSQDLVAGIPMGQPILVGHHSERRHRKTLDKSWNALGKSVETSKAADAEAARARSSAAEAEGYDRPARVGRRIERNRAELGRWQRALARSHSEDVLWTEAAHAAVAELEDKIARDEAVLEESGVTMYGKETVQQGDLVKIRGGWHAVDKANPKTVAVTSFGLSLTYAYTEIQAHKRPTPEQLRKLYENRHDSDLQGCLRSRKLPSVLREVIEAIVVERAQQQEEA